MIPSSRLYVVNDAPIRGERRYVVYWMTSARRLHYNFGLQHAVERARELERPLIVFEALRCGYEHANDRLHAFVLQGMAEHAASLTRGGATYYPYVEPSPGAGSRPARSAGARRLPRRRRLVPRVLLSAHAGGSRAAGRRPARGDRLNGLLPIADAGRAIPMAHGFRSHLQRNLRAQLRAWPAADPLAGLPARRRASVPSPVLQRWPAADRDVLSGRILHTLPIDHRVRPVAIRGGTRAGRERLGRFVESGLARGRQPSQPARRGRDQPAVAVAALRTPLGRTRCSSG